MSGEGATRALLEFLGSPEQAHDALRSLFDTSNGVLLVVDQQGRVVLINRYLKDLFGLDATEFEGAAFDVLMTRLRGMAESATDFDAVLERLRKPYSINLKHRLDPEQMNRFTVRFAAPVVRDVIFYMAPVEDPERGPLGAIWSLSDITGFRRAEELRALADVTPIPLFVARSRDGAMLHCNEEMAKVLGQPVAQLIGQPVSAFLAHPEDRRRLVKTLEQQGFVRGQEVQIRGATGLLWALFSLVRSQTSEGPVIIGGIYDITARKAAEDALAQAHRALAEAQGKLVQSEKMASLGMLVAGIAHEINTPLGAVSSMQDTSARALERLKQALTEDPVDPAKVRGLLQFMDEANRVIGDGTQRVTTIVKRLRSFARLDEAELKTVDLHQGIEDTLILVHHELKHTAKVVRNFGSLPPVACYPGRLNQVFLNLLMNARQALSGSGTITITTWVEDDYARVKIADDGVGIPAANLKRIFDPGFTTKGVAVGTGLGLSICYSIVQEHRGEITVESQEGHGAAFTVHIPLHLDRLLANDSLREP